MSEGEGEREHRCATCGAKIAARPHNPAFPFCTERCRLIDLGRWLDEDYRLPSLDDAPSSDDDEGSALAMVTLDQGGRALPWLEVAVAPAACRGLVELGWIDRSPPGTAAWRVVPDTCGHLILRREASGRIRLGVVGARSTFVDIDRGGHLFTCAVRLAPGALARVARIDAGALTDRGVAPEDVAGGPGAALRRRLEGEEDASRALGHLLDFVAQRTVGAVAIDPRVAGFAAAIARRGRIDAAARALDVAARTLHAVLGREVGLSPKRFARIQRAHAVAAAAVDGRGGGAAAASAAGFSDQAHMLNDFRALFGESPRRFAARGGPADSCKPRPRCRW